MVLVFFVLCGGHWESVFVFCPVCILLWLFNRLGVRFRASKTGLSRPPHRCFLLIVPRFHSCSSSLFVRRWFHMWRLFCHYLVGPFWHCDQLFGKEESDVALLFVGL